MEALSDTPDFLSFQLFAFMLGVVEVASFHLFVMHLILLSGLSIQFRDEIIVEVVVVLKAHNECHPRENKTLKSSNVRYPIEKSEVLSDDFVQVW